ncbi:MAG: phosphotransferase [Ginsengibacter sp.]
MIDFTKILPQFRIDPKSEIVEYGNGLINKTFLVSGNLSKDKFIVQQINHKVFKNPIDVDFNISLIKNYLKDKGSAYFISLPLSTDKAKSMIEQDGEFYRAFQFLPDTTTHITVQNANQAFKAARKFGEFTNELTVDPKLLKITIPDFHNLDLRYNHFSEAIISGDRERISQSKDLINKVRSHYKIVDDYKKLTSLSYFKKRITHHDTKISNVLFDHSENAVSIIDLDTVMPGYFISDFGDMMRTYLSPISEEDRDYSKIFIRKEIYEAVKEGYLEMMGDELTIIEKEHLFYAGLFMVFMQALRFLTDYLNMDKYYGSEFEGQNFIRACNQFTLLDRLYEFEKSLNQ